ncbi:hypothetical protein [Reichenbachiella versicolor]|uniref:hypothetical protein n=1 Tax=Reichenbachiella versicolor TaxID=1821036 RepID=UPI000D6E3B94|nr:hypothetical protein [Reichenbachiella versicolor]
MKKNIIIAVLLFGNLFFGFYAYIKAKEAAVNNLETQIFKLKAENDAKMAEEHRNAAEEAEMKAVELAAKAIKSQREAEEALKTVNNINNV